MQTDDFEWDDPKAARNLADHAVSFATATLAFDDPHGYDELDDTEYYGEERWRWIGLIDDHRLIAVAYCHRGHRIRIISARKAEHHERKLYDAQKQNPWPGG